MVQQQGIEERNKRRALPTTCLIGDAEIGDGGDAGAGGEDGALGQCECEFNMAFFGEGAEPDGLAVGADGVDAGEGDGVFGGEGEDGDGKDFAEEDVDFGEFFRGGGVVEDHVHDAVFEGGAAWAFHHTGED